MHPLVHSPSSTQTFKSKWNTFKEWFTPEFVLLQKRRPSQCSTTSTSTNTTSTSFSVSSNSCCCNKEVEFTIIAPAQPPLTITNSIYNFNGRRPSNSSCYSTATTTTATTNEQIEKLNELYNLAMDEINYAQDSRGSPYYHGDRIAAKEAIENCVSFYKELIAAVVDNNSVLTRIGNKIDALLVQFDALPLQDYDQCSF
jgi:hypothetical protein